MKIKKPKYYSPSTINLFVRDKAKFIMKLANIDSFGGSPATFRGESIEYGLIRKLFYNDEPGDIIKEVDKWFEECVISNKVEKDEKYKKEKASLPFYIDQILQTYNSIEEPCIGTQTKVELELKGVSVPIMGYIDFEFETHIRDLKTTKAIPTKVPHSVQRQLAVYSKATSKQAWVDYVSPKKTTSIRIDNVDDTISEITSICQGIDKFLSISEDAKELANMFYPNLDSWEWDKDSINNAKQLWSIK
jgi:hypothetical protein